MITQDPEGDDITTTRHISIGLLRSQHRPVFLHCGLKIPLTRSVPKHRWNFSGADWDRFAGDLDRVIQFIPAESVVHMTDSGRQWLLQSNVTFSVGIKISIFRDGTINMTSSTKGWILIMKKNQLWIEKLRRMNKENRDGKTLSKKHTSELHNSYNTWNLLKKIGLDPPQIVPIASPLLWIESIRGLKSTLTYESTLSP
jgi:hypothetical protein